MALSVFMHGPRKFSVLSTTFSKLLTAQLKSSQLVITPIAAKQFSAFNRQVEDVKKINPFLNQRRMISHSIIWNLEKLVTITLIPTIPACIYTGGLLCDNILTIVVALHMHWGMEGVVVDYIRPSLCGKIVSTVAHVLVYVFSAMTFGGLMYFNYNDIGLTGSIRRLWAIKPQNDI